MNLGVRWFVSPGRLYEGFKHSKHRRQHRELFWVNTHRAPRTVPAPAQRKHPGHALLLPLPLRRLLLLLLFLSLIVVVTEMVWAIMEKSVGKDGVKNGKRLAGYGVGNNR